jgi:hypothetical protein
VLPNSSLEDPRPTQVVKKKIPDLSTRSRRTSMRFKGDDQPESVEQLQLRTRHKKISGGILSTSSSSQSVFKRDGGGRRGGGSMEEKNLSNCHGENIEESSLRSKKGHHS